MYMYVCVYIYTHNRLGFPLWLSGRQSACSAGETGNMDSVPGSGRFSGEGNGNILQYSCLENPTERGAWWAAVHSVAKGQIRLSN